MGEFDWVEKYVDIKGLAEEIIKRAKKLKIKGVSVEPKGLLAVVALDEIRFRIMETIANIEYREAKLKLEKKKAENAVEKAEQWKKIYEEKLKTKEDEGTEKEGN